MKSLRLVLYNGAFTFNCRTTNYLGYLSLCFFLIGCNPHVSHYESNHGHEDKMHERFYKRDTCMALGWETEEEIEYCKYYL